MDGNGTQVCVVLVALGACAVIGLGGMVFLSAEGRDPPKELSIVTTAAITALGSILVPIRRQP